MITHKYVDVSFLNNNNDLRPREVIFDQQKDTSFLSNLSDYYMSIVRFSMSNTTLPVIIPEVLHQGYDSGQVETDMGTVFTIYGLNIGVSTTGPNNITWSSHTKPVIFVPQVDPNVNTFTGLEPKYYPRNIEELYSNEFYHINNIQHFLDMLNNKLRSCFDNLKANPSYSALLANDLAPYFHWGNNKIELLYTDSFSKYGSTNFYIGMNTQLANLLSGFNLLCINDRFVNNNPSNPDLYFPTMNYVMNFYESPNYNRNGYQVSIVVGGVSKSINMNVLEQMASSVPNWSPVSSIFFTTSTVPVSLTSNMGVRFTGNEVSNTNINTTNISDFVFNMDIGTELTGSLNYVATGEYRFFDLENDMDAKSLFIQCWWRDKYGGNHKIKCPYGASASMKVLFRNKNF